MNDQIDMFPAFENEWEKEWHSMPEFLQENTEPVQQIIVSFQTYHHVKMFAQMIDQNLTSNTKSVWFPKKETLAPKYFLYIDEDEENTLFI